MRSCGIFNHNDPSPFPPAAVQSPDGSRWMDTDGVLVIDKPEGISSFGVVKRVKKWLGLQKAGHCGTLDPFATGVLVVCVNQATRISDLLLSQDKVYRFTVRLGIETDTLDKTGEVTSEHNGPPCDEESVRQAVDAFRGEILQEVPRYAAVKVDGKRLYQLSRRGIEVERPSRFVQIHRIEIAELQWPELVLEVQCSKGTYIRQLTSDIGKRLGCGAHVTGLRRLASGPFTIDGAITLDELDSLKLDGRWEEKLVSLNEALAHLSGLVVKQEALLKKLHHGNLDPEWEQEHREGLTSEAGMTLPVRLLTPSNRLVALWWPQSGTKGTYRLRVFERK